MPRSGSGVYAPTPSSVAPAVDGTTISGPDFNALINDVAAEITNSWDRGGRGAATANMDIGGFKLLNLAAPALGTDAVNLNYLISKVQTSAMIVPTPGGTADAITGAFTPAVTAFTNGMMALVRSTGANTVISPTFQADALAAKTIFKGAGNVVAIGDIPAAGYWMLLVYDAAFNAGAGGWCLMNPAFTLPIGIPQGRLTLASATPVMSATVSGATTVYYTPYLGNQTPIFNVAGTTSLGMTTFAELSQATTDATKSPAACAANKNYDLFLWNDAGTLRCTRGAAWTNDTTRATALTRSSGLLVNNGAVTNGPASGKGIYVGTVRTNGSSQIDYIFGASSAGGTAGFLGLWNMYNRRLTSTSVQDSTVSWTYTTATWRQANASNGMQVSYVIGIAEENISAVYTSASSSTSGGSAGITCGVGDDSITSPSGVIGAFTGSASTLSISCGVHRMATVGFHYFAALEMGGISGGIETWYGNGYNSLVVDIIN